MFHHLNPSGSIDPLRGAVEAILACARARGLSPGDRVWSVCELRVDEKDYCWLEEWARGLHFSFLITCENHPEHRIMCGDRWVNLNAALGLMLILFSAESARRHATEGTLWPHVRADESDELRFGEAADARLFVQGAPSSQFKEWIKAAARGFRLRHALDIEDAQRYYRTIFLQFGFPIKDAEKRLALWLVGGCAQVVSDQLRDCEDALHSEDFCVLWEVLRGYRRNNIGSKATLQRLRDNPWILPEWAEELLDPARKEVSGGDSAGDQVRERFLTEQKPRLRWNPPDAPTLVVEIRNPTELGLTGSQYEVRLGGRGCARLFRFDEDQFEVEPAGDVQFPLSASATISVELVDRRDGEVARAESVECWDASALATVFRLHAGGRLEPGEKPTPSGDYAILAAADLKPDPEPDCWCVIRGRSEGESKLKLWRLKGSDVSRVCLRDEQGREVWRHEGSSSATEPEWIQRVNASFHDAENGNLLTRQPAFIRIAHPSDVEVIFARCGHQPLDCTAEGPKRTRAGPIVIPPEKLVYPDQNDGVRNLDLVVGLIRGGRSSRVDLKVPVCGSGAARLCGDEWRPLGEGVEVEVDRAAPELFHVVPPSSWEKRKVKLVDWAVMEGNTWIGSLERSASLLKLAGLGARLTVRRSRYNLTGDAMVLAAKVVNRGVVRGISTVPIPERDRTRIEIELIRPLVIDQRFRVAIWRRDGRLDWVEPEHPVIDGKIAEDRWITEASGCDSQPRAVVVAYDGDRRGLWWAEDWHQGLEQLGADQARDLAIHIRWMRPPILAGEALDSVRGFATKSPAQVLEAWALVEQPPRPMDWSRGGDVFRSAARIVFRDWEPGPEVFANLVESATNDGEFDEIPEVRLSLKLLELSPMLMGKMLRSCLERGGVWQSDPRCARAVLGRLQQQIHERIVSRDQRREGLEGAREKCAKNLGGVDPVFLDDMLAKGAKHVLCGDRLDPVDADNLDVAIGEVLPFRDLLASKILQGFDAPGPKPSGQGRRALSPGIFR